MKRIFRIAAMLAAVMTLAVSCNSNTTAPSAEAAEPAVADADPLAGLVIEKVYDDDADTAAQIADALKEAKASGRYVMAQVGGNWCKWCLRFAAFVKADEDLSKLVNENYVYIHVNNQKVDPATGKKVIDAENMAKLGNPGRFGYPVFVVLDADGKVLHIQDSSLLEAGELYDKDKVARFFKNWTPSAVNK